MSKRQKRATNEKRAIRRATEDAEAQIRLAEALFREQQQIPEGPQREMMALVVNECVREATWKARFSCRAWRAVFGDDWIYGNVNREHKVPMPEGV